MATMNEREPLGMILRGATLAHLLGAEVTAIELIRWAGWVLEAEARLLSTIESAAEAPQPSTNVG